MHFVAICWHSLNPPEQESIRLIVRKFMEGAVLSGWTCSVLEEGPVLFISFRQGKNDDENTNRDVADEIIAYQSCTGVPSDISRIFDDQEARKGILPPFVGARFQPKKAILTVCSDYFGIGRVYYGANSKAFIISTRAAVVRDLVQAELDIQAMATFAAVGWFMSSTTPWTGVRALDANSTIQVSRASSGQAAISIHKYPVALMNECEATEPIEEVASRLTALAGQIVNTIGEPVRLGLSGGRDSRLVASAFASVGATMHFSTTAWFIDEVELAQRVSLILPVRSRHTIIDPLATGRVAHDLASSARRLVAFHDGMFEPSYIGSRMPGPGVLPPTQSRPLISGLGGELAHGHYYSNVSMDRLRTMTDDAARQHLVRRLCALRTHTPLGMLALEEVLAGLQVESSSNGWSGPRFMDWFYLRERLRRWSALGSLTEGAVAILASHAFIKASFAQPLEALSQSTLHRRLIAYLCPNLEHVPFFAARSSAPQHLRTPQLQLTADLKASLLDSRTLAIIFASGRLVECLDACASGTATPMEQAVVKRATWIQTLLDSANEQIAASSNDHRRLGQPAHAA